VDIDEGYYPNGVSWSGNCLPHRQIGLLTNDRD
jgi:hypothetical protein